MEVWEIYEQACYSILKNVGLDGSPLMDGVSYTRAAEKAFIAIKNLELGLTVADDSQQLPG